MKQKLFNYLNQNGYGYEGNDHLIKFNVNDLHFYCQFFPKDPFFFRIILPCEDDLQVSNTRSVIAEINSRYKVAKIIEVNNGKLSTERVQFSLNTRDDSGEEFELMVRESGQDDYEVAARFPFRAKLAFAGTFSFDF